MPKPRSEILPGTPYPLGATPDGNGVNFSLFSEHATGVTLCLFGGVGGKSEIARIPLAERNEHIWHGYVPGIRAGQRYGYRVSGPYDPPAGHRFNPAKLLIDPCARVLDSMPRWHDSMVGYRASAAGATPHLDSRNSAPVMPKCVVVDSAFDWEGDRKPEISWQDRRHLRGAREGHDRDASRRAAAHSRQVSRGWRRRP